VPSQERSRSLALVYSGMFLGSMLGLTLSPLVIQRLGWPAVFVTFGSMGAVWLAAWMSKAASTPQRDPRCAPEEAAYISANTVGGASMDLHAPSAATTAATTSAAASSNGSAASAAAQEVKAGHDEGDPIPWKALLSRREVRRDASQEHSSNGGVHICVCTSCQTSGISNIALP
jgi:MFS family permease